MTAEPGLRIADGRRRLAAGRSFTSHHRTVNRLNPADGDPSRTFPSVALYQVPVESRKNKAQEKPQQMQ